MMSDEIKMAPLGEREADLETGLNENITCPGLNCQTSSALLQEAVFGSDHPCTDLGNAERLADRVSGRVVYDYTTKKWRYYDGARWALDQTGILETFAKTTVRAIYTEAGLTADPSERALLSKWAVKSEDQRRISAMVTLAKSDQRLARTADAFDRNPWVFNVKNGTIDLRIGALYPHRPEDMLAKLSPVDYAEDARAPRFMRFLDEITLDRDDLKLFLQRFFGYCLTGLTVEQVAAILYGLGMNGKTVLVNLIIAAMGEYAMETPIETFIEKRAGGSIPNDVARLAGARLVTLRETEEGARLAESFFKSATGGDRLSARFLYGEYFDFQPQFKIVLFTNHKPRIRGTDHAIWRRLRLVPFDYRVPPEKKNPHLEEELRAELPGVLAWAVKGCLEWQREGLPDGETVKTATAGYRVDEDSLADWISVFCILGPDRKGKSATLYKSYRGAQDEAGGTCISSRAFASALEERGFLKSHSRTGTVFQGIGLRDPLTDGPGPGSVTDTESVTAGDTVSSKPLSGRSSIDNFPENPSQSVTGADMSQELDMGFGESERLTPSGSSPPQPVSDHAIRLAAQKILETYNVSNQAPEAVARLREAATGSDPIAPEVRAFVELAMKEL